MPEGREKRITILKIDYVIKENRLYMDIISVDPHNNSMSQLYNHKCTADANKVEKN